MRARPSLLATMIALTLTLGPAHAQLAIEEDDGHGVTNGADFSWRVYSDSLARFPERAGLICYNAYLLDKGGRHAEAIPFLTQCAERGVVPSMLQLALVLETGVGVPRDLVTARAWLRRAAETGSALGALHYGWALVTGAGGAVDMGGGRAWLERAASAGEPLAIERLRALASSQG